MRALQYQVLLALNFFCEGLCRASPEKIGARPVSERSQDLPGQFGPAKAGMGIGIACRDGEGGVEQQYPLARPKVQIGIRRAGPKIGLHFLVDIGERARQWVDMGCRGKGQAVGMPRRGIGVLTRITTRVRSGEVSSSAAKRSASGGRICRVSACNAAAMRG